jgi:2-polyprenyl-6-methoxyphenol hydroxylase-like FAD-dependent oxidoreductase
MAKQALVIGCGIGGPAVAMFLRLAGMDVTIYEAASEADGAGAFLNLASNGLAVLETLGVAHEISAVGVRCPRMAMWNGDGKRLGEVRNGALPGEGPSSVIVKRGDLHRILREAALRHGVRIEHGRVLAATTEHAEGIAATFEDGSTAEGDFVLGCDGIHSRTRRIIAPDAPAPRYTGLISCGGYAPTDLAPTTDTQHFVFGKRAFFGYLVKPSGEAFWFNNHAQDGQPRRSDFAHTTDTTWKRTLQDMHAADQPFIAHMIGATTSPISAYPIYDLPPLRTWHRGRCAILGDAAHAMSPSAGQGASIALEDAIVAAQCIRDIPQIHAAFASFERQRKARAERVVAYGRTSGSNKVASNAVSRWARDLVLPIVLRRFVNTAPLDWLYGYRVDWNARVAR